MEFIMITLMFLSMFWKAILVGIIVFVVLLVILGSIVSDKAKDTINYFENPNSEPLGDKFRNWVRTSDSDVAQWFRNRLS